MVSLLSITDDKPLFSFVAFLVRIVTNTVVNFSKMSVIHFVDNFHSSSYFAKFSINRVAKREHIFLIPAYDVWYGPS